MENCLTYGTGDKACISFLLLNINLQGPSGLMSVFLTSLHVWLTFGTDRELQNTVEIGNFPPEKV